MEPGVPTVRLHRFRLRTLMIAVAVVAWAIAAAHVRVRAKSFRARAAYHSASALHVRRRPESVAMPEKQAAYHDSLRGKYERAARYPWLPVAPDPPEPQ